MLAREGVRARIDNLAGRERSMFESVFSKVSEVIGLAVRRLGAVVQRIPWVVPVTILAVFAVWR